MFFWGEHSVPHAMERLPDAVVAERGAASEQTGGACLGEPGREAPSQHEPADAAGKPLAVDVGPYAATIPQSPRSRILQNFVGCAGG